MKREELSELLNALEVSDSNLIVHSSLRSFDRLEGGVGTVIEELKQISRNLLMPAFSSDAIVRPPANDHPTQNGCDYNDEKFWILNSKIPFSPAKQKVDSRMGQIAVAFAQDKSVLRSPHPWHAWSAFGVDAQALVQEHNWNTPHQPLINLLNTTAYVVLIGVGLNSCTAIHLAEERAGRRPFIRWVLDQNSEVKRIKVAGCAAGFENLRSGCADLFRSAQLPNGVITVAPFTPLVERCREIIEHNPEITRCSSTCLRCADAIRGGPLAS